MSDFEGFDGQTALQPSGKQFWTRCGVNEMAVTGNGSLPPGAKETPGFPQPGKNVKAVTPAGFVKSVGG